MNFGWDASADAAVADVVSVGDVDNTFADRGRAGVNEENCEIIYWISVHNIVP